MAKNLFNSIKITPPKRNQFDLSHDVKLTLDMGQLVPVMVQECVPGDTFTIGCKTLLRFAPLVSPVMHRMDLRVEYFFVPNRIMWNDWEDFITGKNAALVHPYIEYTPDMYLNSPLIDYLGLPSIQAPVTNRRVSAFPFAAYQRIWNEYYRDQNLQVESPADLVGGNNTSNSALRNIKNRCWEHDYFTSALPWAQKGDPVDIPLGKTSPLEVFHNDVFNPPTQAQTDIDGTVESAGTPTSISVRRRETTDLVGGRLYTEGSDVEPTTINDLRRAFSLQRFLELSARAGTRYIEMLRAFFGVRSSDARLQRPEYIVGVKSPVIISEVLNTAGQNTLDPEDPGLPQGNMAGHGIAVVDGNYGRYNCEEHGFIIGVMSVIPKTAYQQGIPKHYLYNDRYDYYWQQFDHIGEQAIENQEIYAQSSTPEGTFGYTPRYSHLKYTPSRVAGDFKTSLDFWHMGRIFASPPTLNNLFVQCNPDKRIFAVDSLRPHSLYAQVLNQVSAVRPMSRYSTPM